MYMLFVGSVQLFFTFHTMSTFRRMNLDFSTIMHTSSKDRLSVLFKYLNFLHSLGAPVLLIHAERSSPVAFLYDPESFEFTSREAMNVGSSSSSNVQLEMLQYHLSKYRNFGETSDDFKDLRTISYNLSPHRSFI